MRKVWAQPIHQPHQMPATLAIYVHPNFENRKCVKTTKEKEWKQTNEKKKNKTWNQQFDQNELLLISKILEFYMTKMLEETTTTKKHEQRNNNKILYIYI